MKIALLVLFTTLVPLVSTAQSFNERIAPLVQALRDSLPPAFAKKTDTIAGGYMPFSTAIATVASLNNHTDSISKKLDSVYLYVGGLPTMLGLFIKIADTSNMLRVYMRKGDTASLSNRINNISLTPGPTGPVGPQGIQGIQGATGATGPQGTAGTNGTNASVSLTTTGTGSATYNAGTGALNIPTPSIPTNNNQLTNGSGYISGNQTVTLSGDVAGSGTTSVATTLGNTGVTAGTYNASYTVDSKGRINSATNISINASPARALSTTGTNNTFTISTTKAARARYTVNFSVALIAAASNGVVTLDYSIDAGTTWVTAGSVSQVYSASVTLATSGDQQLSGDIPANALVRVYRSANTNCTITLPTTKQQEITY